MAVNPDVGSHVLHYRLVRRLGSGGMGEVFLAEDGRLHRQVAIKFLLGPSDDHLRERLLQEARALAALDHPAICALHEISSDPAHGDFIVMQFVEGEALSDRLKRGRLRPDEALTLAARIADALIAPSALSASGSPAFHSSSSRVTSPICGAPQSFQFRAQGQPVLPVAGTLRGFFREQRTSEGARATSSDGRAQYGTRGRQLGAPLFASSMLRSSHA